MRPMLYLLLLGAGVCLGCSDERMLSPVDPVITEGAVGDFGLEGIWEAPDPRAAFDTSAEPLTIIRGAEGVYEVASPSLQHYEPKFRVTKLLDGHDHLILEAEWKTEGERDSRLLAIVLPQGDRLHYWPLLHKNFAKCMADDGHEYDSEAAFFAVHVQADSEKLKSTIRRQARELIGPVTTFVRVKAE